MTARFSWKTLAAMTAAAAILAGCAHPQLIDPGMSTQAVADELGTPDAKVALEDGGMRYVYSLQPMSQQVWWVNFDASGKVTSRENVLDRKHFALIRPGVDTKETVWNLFGRCAQEYHFALIDQDAWMYRFLDDGFFFMACWVQFDMNGVVTEVGYTIDPWHDRGDDWLS